MVEPVLSPLSNTAPPSHLFRRQRTLCPLRRSSTTCPIHHRRRPVVTTATAMFVTHTSPPQSNIGASFICIGPGTDSVLIGLLVAAILSAFVGFIIWVRAAGIHCRVRVWLTLSLLTLADIRELFFDLSSGRLMVLESSLLKSSRSPYRRVRNTLTNGQSSSKAPRSRFLHVHLAKGSPRSSDDDHKDRLRYRVALCTSNLSIYLLSTAIGA